MNEIKKRRSNTAEKFGMKAPDRKPGESMYEYSQRLSKMADRRLRNLEKLSNEDGFSSVTKYAYANAMHDIKALYGEDAKRFQRRPSKTKIGKYNEKQMRKQINAAKRFLEMPSSTKRGITKIYKERAATLNKKYGTSFTWQQLAEFFDKELNTIIDLKAGSKTKMKAIGFIQRHNFKTAEELEKYVKESSENNTKVPDQEVIEQAKKLLKEKGSKIVNFFFD